jgi:predicted transcriptional regulator
LLTSAQIRAARALLRWEQKDLAQASKVSLPTIKRLEVKAGALGAHEVTIEAIVRAFDAAGVEFIAAEMGKGVGVRFKNDQCPSG